MLKVVSCIVREELCFTHDLDQLHNIGGLLPMKKYINITQALGLIVLIMAMPFFYTAIFFGSFFLE
jgi:hypothetical protein